VIAVVAGAVAVAAGVIAILLLPRGGPGGRTVEIPAVQPWADTDVDCQTGKLLEITATGTVFPNSRGAVGPDGDSSLELRNFNLPGLPDVNHAALVGSIDRQQPYFVVGKKTTYKCPRADGLFIGINDRIANNNSGKFTSPSSGRKAIRVS
jgi:hypothetical protein